MKAVDFTNFIDISRPNLATNLNLVKQFSEENRNAEQCGNCNKSSTERLSSESWTSALYCRECESITLKIHVDKMGGNCADDFEVYN